MRVHSIIDWKSTVVVCAFLAVGAWWVIDMARNGETVGWVIIGTGVVLALLGFFVLAIIVIVIVVGRKQRGEAIEPLRARKLQQDIFNSQLVGEKRLRTLDDGSNGVASGMIVDPNFLADID